MRQRHQSAAGTVGERGRRALSSLLGKVDDCVAAFTNHLDLRGDLLERSAASRAKLAAYQREFKKLGDGMSMLGRARTLKDYYGGLQIIKSSEFSVVGYIEIRFPGPMGGMVN
jgi:hypothetical protein